jgi:hypothetical protein
LISNGGRTGPARLPPPRPPRPPRSPPRASLRRTLLPAAGAILKVELDRLLVVHEREGRERQIDRGDFPLQRAGKRCCKTLVIEGRPFLSRPRVHEDELVASLHRSPVIEAIGLFDEAKIARRSNREVLVPVAKRQRALVVGHGRLGKGSRGEGQTCGRHDEEDE